MTERPASPKSADAYRTISEVAEDLKLPQHVLRFWETRFPQVKPLKRAGGRRFYRPEDVELLRAVKALLYGDGYTIKGVQRMLREQGPRALARVAAEVRPRTGRSVSAEAGEGVAHEDGRGARDLDGRDGTDPMREGDAPPAWLLGGPETESDTAPHTPQRDSATPEQGFLEVGLASWARGRLQAVLIDLADCERLLTAARAEQRR